MYNNILLIDDSNIDREVISIYLGDLKMYTIQHADNGEVASEILMSKTFELIICDVDMPVCDGLDFLKRLSLIDKSIPILMISSTALDLSQSILLMAKQLGFNFVSFLQKPFSIGALEQKIISLKLSQSVKSSDKFDFTLDELITALYQNKIVNYYQSKIAVKSREIVGYEVLSRFLHPTKGTISAANFLTRNLPKSFYCQLFLCSLEKAIRYWKVLDVDVTFSINVSPDILSNIGMVNSIVHLVELHGFDFNKIVIEITEGNSYLLDSDFLYSFNKLSLLGIRFSIDDFGEDYATFKKLLELSFYELKISRAFLLSAFENDKAHSMLKNIISLCKDVNIKTVAEGVESEELLSLSTTLGFDIFQGFLLGKPAREL